MTALLADEPLRLQFKRLNQQFVELVDQLVALQFKMLTKKTPTLTPIDELKTCSQKTLFNILDFYREKLENSAFIWHEEYEQEAQEKIGLSSFPLKELEFKILHAMGESCVLKCLIFMGYILPSEKLTSCQKKLSKLKQCLERSEKEYLEEEGLANEQLSSQFEQLANKTEKLWRRFSAIQLKMLRKMGEPILSSEARLAHTEKIMSDIYAFYIQTQTIETKDLIWWERDEQALQKKIGLFPFPLNELEFKILHVIVESILLKALSSEGFIHSSTLISLQDKLSPLEEWVEQLEKEQLQKESSRSKWSKSLKQIIENFINKIIDLICNQLPLSEKDKGRDTIDILSSLTVMFQKSADKVGFIRK